MNEHLRAFSLDPDQVPSIEDLNGLTVSFGPQLQMLDVKAALISGYGTIVAENPDLISALRGVPVLKEVEVKEGAQVTEVNVSLDAPLSPTPVGVIPQGAPPSELNTGDEVPAVHADESPTVEGVVAQGEQVGGPPVVDGTPGNTDDTDDESDPEPTSTPRPSRASR